MKEHGQPFIPTSFLVILVTGRYFTLTVRWRKKPLFLKQFMSKSVNILSICKTISQLALGLILVFDRISSLLHCYPQSSRLNFSIFFWYAERSSNPPGQKYMTQRHDQYKRIWLIQKNSPKFYYNKNLHILTWYLLLVYYSEKFNSFHCSSRLEIVDEYGFFQRRLITVS